MSTDLRRLRVAFESHEAFQREFDSNLSNGGAFVRTEESFEPRETVMAELCFEFSGQSLELEADVVHIVPPEMAGAGGTPGVALQFQLPVSRLRQRLSQLAMETTDPKILSLDSGQRTARRKPVRVPAKIQGDHEVVSGQTRDLSLTGALVGTGGQALPLGDSVSLLLEHPNSGEQWAIGGEVVRQVVANGEVSALAVEFTPPEEDRAEIERFIQELQGLEHTRRLGGISGPIDELGPQNLLQMFATSSQNGTLVLRRDQEEGLICFGGGLLRLAQLGSATGMKALVRMLSWTEGVFEFQARIDDREMNEPPFPLEAALFDAVRQIDESTTFDQGNFPLQGRLVRNLDGDLDAHGDPSKVEAAVLDLANAGFTVQRALEVIPESDPEIFRALQTLADAQLLRIET